jgi:oligopeptide transport system permease protein
MAVETGSGVRPSSLTAIPPARKGRSLWYDAWRQLKKNKLAVAGLIFIIVLAIASYGAPLFAPYSYDEGPLDFSDARIPPRFPDHLMGTDKYSWDVLSRILYGGQVSLTVGIIGALTALIIGATYGAISGYMGGRVDNGMMRMVDVLYGFPTLLFVILIMVVLPAENFIQDMTNIFIAIGIVSWMGMARLVRGQFLALREKEFVDAARMVGVRPMTIIFRHLLPNSIGPAIVWLTLTIPTLILTEAILSFIGLGVRPPFPSWGQMISEAWRGMQSSPHLVIFPGLAIVLTMLAFNFLGDGLRDALDPRHRRD